MKRVAWWDCSAGAAGDMLLAACIDAGANPDRVEAGLRSLAVGDWEMHLVHVTRGAFRALHLRFEVPEAHHPHRPWTDVRDRITEAELPARVQQRALAAYLRLALAEAHLHGIPVDEVELHEVGAVDAILDVVGVALALEQLGIDRVVATALPMGEGSVDGAHGRIPLPAPATLAVLQGWPLVAAPGPGEWVTPTGATLVATLAEAGPFPAMTPAAVGMGAGTRDPAGVANLVRMVVGEPVADSQVEEVVELACNVDDLSGELVPPVLDMLLEEGALDAWATPVHMKKGRPGLLLQALVRPVDADRLSDVVLRHSSTLGVRRKTWRRSVLERWVETVGTPYGPVRIKVGGRDGVAWHAAPEFEDVAERARTSDATLQEVHASALAAWRSQRP